MITARTHLVVHVHAPVRGLLDRRARERAGRGVELERLGATQEVVRRALAQEVRRVGGPVETTLLRRISSRQRRPRTRTTLRDSASSADPELERARLCTVA